MATDSAQVRDLGSFDAIWLVPGSPYRDDRSAYAAVTWARVNNVPFLGTCGGMQYAVIEFVRNVLAEPDASHAESDGVDETNVVTALACTLQGEEREVRPVRGTRAALQRLLRAVAAPAAGRRPGGQARPCAAARIRPLRRRRRAICPAWHDLDMTQQLRPTTW